MNSVTELDIESYIANCNAKVGEYYNGVKNGSIVVNDYMKYVIDWLPQCRDNHPLYEVRYDKVDFVFAYLYLVNILNDVEGFQRIDLMPWQAYLIAMLFGIYRKGTNERRFSEALLYMGRGNGKSPIGDTLGTYFMISDEFVNPDAIIVSTVENRRKVYDDIKNIIINSPEIYPHFHFNNGVIMLNNVESNIRLNEPRQIVYTNNAGKLKVVPNIGKKLDGLNLVYAFVDEVHTFSDETVLENIKKSTAKRTNSLMLMCSTAGFETKSFFTDLIDKSKKVAKGEIEDDKFLPFLYCLDETDDREDLLNEDLWKKCNPSLGVIKKKETMMRSYNDSLYSPKSKAELMTKDLNIFIDYNEEEILSINDILKASQYIDIESLKGRNCYLGLDLSKSNDLSSLVALFEPLSEDDIWLSYPYYWIGNDSKLLKRKNGEDLTPWINKGYITKCDTKYIDNALIAKQIEQCTKDFNVIGIGYDPYGWNELNKYLIEYDIYPGEKVGIIQWTKHMAEPLSKILMLILSEKLSFSDNPVMTWNFKNAKIRIADANGNLKIMKNECKDSVDGAIALNNAMALYYKVTDPNAKAF